jgi:hypothetical protein
VTHLVTEFGTSIRRLIPGTMRCPLPFTGVDDT